MMEREEENDAPAERFESSSRRSQGKRKKVNLDDLPIEVLYAILDILKAQEYDQDWQQTRQGDPNQSNNGRLFRR